MTPTQHLRLTHPELDFWVDVRVREFDGRWLAVADLADERDVGSGESATEAFRGALGAFPARLREDLVADAPAQLLA